MEDKEQVIDDGQTASAVTPDEKPLSKDEVEKLIQDKVQRETDRVRTEYSKKLKALETEKETLAKEKMTEEEKREFELKQAQATIQEKEKAYNQKLLELNAIEWLKAEGLDTDFKNYVIGNDEDTTKARIKEFRKQWDSAIKKEIETKFQSNSRTPNQSSDGLTKERINTMSINEINANWDSVSKVLEQK